MIETENIPTVPLRGLSGAGAASTVGVPAIRSSARRRRSLVPSGIRAGWSLRKLSGREASILDHPQRLAPA